MPDDSPRTFTFRAFVAGSLLSALVVVMAHLSINIIHGSYLDSCLGERIRLSLLLLRRP